MLRAIRSMLRWQFAIEAFVLADRIFAALLGRSRSLFGSLPHVTWTFHASSLVVVYLCAAAWWTTRRPKSGRNIFAVAACVINTLAFSPILYFIRQLGPGMAVTFVGLASLNIAGIVAFSKRQIPAATPPPKMRRIVGDCTSPLMDNAFIPVTVLAVWILDGLSRKFAPPRLSHYSPLSDPLLFALAIILDATIHECGHALAAHAFQMRFLAFNAGPLQWIRLDGRGRFRLNLAGTFGGSVAVVPTRSDQPRWQEACVLFAGPLANLCTTPIFVWAAFRIENTPYFAAWPLLNYLAMFALIDGIFNFLPIRVSKGAYSDGARLLQLLTDSPTLQYDRAIHRLQLTLFTPIRSRDFDAMEFLQLVDFAPSEEAVLHLHLCAAQILEDSGRIPEAAAQIAAAESIYARLSLNLPGPLHTAFVYFHASHNHDAAAARLWWDRMNAKKIERRNVDYWIAATAVAWIEGRFSQAEEAWLQADTAAQKLPHFGAYEFDRYRVARLRSLLNGAHSNAVPDSMADFAARPLDTPIYN